MEAILSSEFKKVISLLKVYYTTHAKLFADILNASRLDLLKHWNSTIPAEWKIFDLNIYVQHEIYLSFYSQVDSIVNIIKTDINKISDFTIDKIKILPDYERMEISDSEIRAIVTDWEEINAEQVKLIRMLQSSTDSLDLQNIGNTSRSILVKLASIVFDSSKHTPFDKEIKLGIENYKNRLHSFIKSELSGEHNKELRQFSVSSIETVEKSINLANTVTHKLGVERSWAILCIIGTISTISIVKLVYDQGK